MRKLGLIFTIIVYYFFSIFSVKTCFAENYKFSEIETTVFKTDRLILMPTVDDDLEILSEYLLDKDVTKYLGPSMGNGFKNKEEAREHLKVGRTRYKKTRALTIKLKEDKYPIGQLTLGLKDDENVQNSLRVNFGYWLGKDFQGKGYAQEACFEVCNKVFNASDINTILIACDVRNTGSKELANKILNYLIEQNKENFENLKVVTRDQTIKIKDGEVHYKQFFLSKP